MHPLVGRHRPGRVHVGVVRRVGLGALGEGEHEDRSEMQRQPGQHPDPDVAAPRCADVLPEQPFPVRGVPFLGLGQSQQDLPLLTGAAGGQPAVDLGRLAFVGEPAAPLADRSR